LLALIYCALNLDIHLPYEILNLIYGFLFDDYMIPILFDLRYSSPRNALECSVIVCHAEYKSILCRSNISRKRINDCQKSIACQANNLEMFALSECMKQLRKSLEVWLQHWTGERKDCDNCSGSKHLDLDKKKHRTLFNKISKLFSDLSNNTEKYVGNLANFIVESINLAILVGAPKTVDYHLTYGGRVDSQLARSTIGEL